MFVLFYNQRNKLWYNNNMTQKKTKHGKLSNKYMNRNDNF